MYPNQAVTEESYDHQDQAVPQTVTDTVQQRRPRFIGEGESFDTPHDDTVGDDQSDIYGQLFADIVSESFQQLIDDDYKSGHNDQLYDDTDTGRNGISHQRKDHIRESGYGCYSQSPLRGCHLLAIQAREQ